MKLLKNSSANDYVKLKKFCTTEKMVTTLFLTNTHRIIKLS